MWHGAQCKVGSAQRTTPVCARMMQYERRGAHPSTGSQWLQASFRPRVLVSSMSRRSNCRPQYMKDLGPARTHHTHIYQGQG
jgi:hypothetical protein